MAALVFFPLDYFCFSLLIVSVNSIKNSTSNYFNSTAWEDLNFTSESTFVASTEPTIFGSTTRSSGGTEVPPLPAEPLPVSGRLPTPVTAVDSLCPCDEHAGVCDSSCCCDADCQQEVALFTSCSVSAVSGSKQLCSREVASYALRTRIDGFSELLKSVQTETNDDVFCIQSYSHVDALSLPPPALPTNRNFQSLFQRFSSFVFGPQSNQELPAAVQSSPGYQFGDVLRTAGPSGGRGVFYLPAAGVTAACVDRSPAAFLKDQQSRCSRRVIPETDCSSLPALSVESYSSILLLNGKNPDAAVLPVGVSSVVLQSTEGTQSELTVGAGVDLRPALLSGGVCARAVLKVDYVIRYSAAGEVVSASVSLVLGFIREASVLLQQDFRVTFVQDGGDLALRFSGSPGYVVGLPLLSGTKTAEGISRSVELRDALSLLHGGEERQDCLRGPHRRSPVLFGLNSVSGCSLRLEDTTNCSLVSLQLLDVLRGPNFPQYVASFGNSPLNSQLDWISIQSGFGPVGEQGCSIPLSLHLEIQWTQYGSLQNPQAQIVSIREIIQTNSSSLPLLTAGGSSLPVQSSVAFIPVSADALPGYRATPTINAKLPFHFFFPFV